MAISNRLRFEIFRRDGFRCTYCGLTAQEVALTVDHVTPRALGGVDHPSNLTTACEPCNSGKSSTLVNSPVLKAAPQPAEKEDEEGEQRAALIAVWVNETDEDITNERGHAFTASVDRALDSELDSFHRLAEAAQYCAWYGVDDIEAGLAKLDRDNLVGRWALAWQTETGDYPDEEATAEVTRQIDLLLGKNAFMRERLQASVIQAGSICSSRLHFALTDDELAESGFHTQAGRMRDAWRAAIRSATGRWPTSDDVESLRQGLSNIPNGCCWWEDMRRAAAAAGAYESTDLRTCLTPHGSVFEAAALLLDPAAASAA